MSIRKKFQSLYESCVWRKCDFLIEGNKNSIFSWQFRSALNRSKRRKVDKGNLTIGCFNLAEICRILFHCCSSILSWLFCFIRVWYLLNFAGSISDNFRKGFIKSMWRPDHKRIRVTRWNGGKYGDLSRILRINALQTMEMLQIYLPYSHLSWNWFDRSAPGILLLIRSKACFAPSSDKDFPLTTDKRFSNSFCASSSDHKTSCQSTALSLECLMTWSMYCRTLTLSFGQTPSFCWVYKERRQYRYIYFTAYYTLWKGWQTHNFIHRVPCYSLKNSFIGFWLRRKSMKRYTERKQEVSSFCYRPAVSRKLLEFQKRLQVKNLQSLRSATM